MNRAKNNLYVLFLFGVSLLITQCDTSKNLNGNFLLKKTPFGVCYAKVTPEQIKNYELVIIEPDFYSKSEINALKATGTTIIAYMTLGEVDLNRWYFPLLEEEGFLGINENWNSSYLNLESDETRAIILDKVLPEIMIKGVDGVFLDTIDSVSPYTERSNLIPFMVEVIKGVRDRYPKTIIIQNAGLFLLEESKNVIDAVLIEDIASGYNFINKDYYIKDLNSFHERVEIISAASKKYNLPFLIVDFAEEPSALKEIKVRLDSLYFPYFISNIQLNQLPVKPERVANKIKVN
tara:strand:+ start:10189 stop:11064 length:876 start_codon:yes stop_codon:yes gene_type:complete